MLQVNVGKHRLRVNGGKHHSRSSLQLFFFSFEPDLDLSVLANSGFASEGTTIPPFGAISLPRGLPSFEARSFRLMQRGCVIFSSCC